MPLRDTELSETKRVVRATLKARRAALPAEQRVRASALACQHLKASEAWPIGGGVALFAPFGDEIDPTALAVYAPGLVAYPQVVADDLIFRVAELRDLTPAPPFGIPEPAVTCPVVEDLALIVVPGLGFTKEGHRIGYGRGFYDRALLRLRLAHPRLVAVGFGFAAQIEPTLPVGPQDQPLDALVTEDGFSWTRPRRG